MFDMHVQLIHKLLDKACSKRTFNNERAKSLYEKGYLIGLLASLSYNDSNIRHKLMAKIKK